MTELYVVRQFNRGYEGAEHALRLSAFRLNFDLVAKHNAEYESGRETYHMGLNQFADMEPSEFKKMLGYKPSMRKVTSGADPLGKACTHTELAVNASVDWRQVGAGNTSHKNLNHDFLSLANYRKNFPDNFLSLPPRGACVGRETSACAWCRCGLSSSQPRA